MGENAVDTEKGGRHDMDIGKFLHKSTKMCKKGSERKRRRLAEAEIRESMEMAFEVYGQ